VSAIRATYRVQLNAGFTFDDAAAIVDYLADLGISHLYCSPYLQAAPGSAHGYDVVDHHRLNAELGGEEGHARLVGVLRAHGMGHVVDIVPNHMAVVGRSNAWWWDVLENGPSSRYAPYFDIDWDPPERRLTTKVLLPVLGDHFGRVLEAGELQVVREGGSFVVRYHEHEAPVSPRTIDDLLARAAERTGSDELASLANAFGRLPHALVTDRALADERHRDKEVLRNRLADVLAADATLAAAVDDEVKALDEDFDQLDRLLQRQNYRLAYWRTAGRELDYRRFFDITTLAGLRIEDPQVFADTHALVLDLVARGDVAGVRVDHVDGLRDPEGYVRRLRDAVGPGAYVVVEKILARDESLPASWPVEGTTGYDFLADVDALLVDPECEAALTAAYARFTGESAPFDEVATTAKHEIMRSVLAADVERVTERLGQVCEGDRRHRDHTRSELRDALRETAAALDVYRTYAGEPDGVARMARATALASDRRPDLEPELFGFLAERLRGDDELAARFRQLTPPVMAKSVEDTAFYRHHRLVSANEVGGHPAHLGMTVAEFHDRQQRRTPTTMLSISTHDTKRSADVRARIAVLAGLVDAWEAAVWRWAHQNDRHRTGNWPDRNAEYLLYQTIVGAWPLPVDRAVAYMEKATKEAKVHTSWVDPNPDYDDAVRRFTAAVVGDAELAADVECFLDEHGVVAAGRRNSLVQLALALTCPGVPDIYQGTELWDLSLVDPDNRRPVDYASRRACLAKAREMDETMAVSLLDDKDDPGLPKLWLLERLLRLRAERPELFAPDAGYEPIEAAGRNGDRVVAFQRANGALTVVATLQPTQGTFPVEITVA
jgi:(1->4)-alpha-D-glucan 1-alpha-D-glucosylmutase